LSSLGEIRQFSFAAPSLPNYRLTLNPFILKDNRSYDLRFLLANINSTLHSYVYTESSTAAGKDDFRQTTLTALEALPIRRINYITPQEQRDLYRQKAVELYEYCIDHDEDEEFACIMGFVETHLEAQPEETDVVHDLLVILAEQMLKLNGSRHDEQKKLLKWLEQHLRIEGHKMGIEILKQGTRIANFVGDYQLKGSELQLDRLLWVLDLPKNKRRYGGSFSKLEADIAERYQISLAKVSEINRSLRLTDKLIDKVIYKLYGLTNDEIKLVES
jgi:hypothetical protein